MKSSPARVRFFRKQLKQWFRDHKRVFPWRRTRNPYFLFIAEMMLRRTRADQVMPVFERFVERFPSPSAVVGAPAEAARFLEPLGLRWRAQTLLTALQQVQDTHSGRIPLDPEKLRELDGVGPYVSNAVLCFGKGAPYSLVDTNVLRVLCRYEGIGFRDGLRRNSAMLRLADGFLDRKDPRTYTYAMIDLAHAVCVPRRPRCPLCPLQQKCQFSRQNSKGKHSQ